MRIDNAFSKDQILELYLNEIFLGENSYGVAAAATNYFGKSLDELSLSQTAFLAGLPKGPANYSPTPPQGCGHRAAQLRARSDVGERLHHARSRATAPRPKTSSPITGRSARSSPMSIISSRKCAARCYEKYGEKALYDGGLQVRSTLDPRLQDIAVRSLRAGLCRL